MKKTIIMLLLTALCLTFFTSCDMGNGLVAELLGDLKEMGDHVEIYPTIDQAPPVYMESVEVDLDEYYTAIEVETMPPVEYDPPVEYPTEDVTYSDEVPQPPIATAPSLGDVLTLDGELSDWNLGVGASVLFDHDNLDAWVGEVGDKGFTMYTATDSEYVYFAFDVTDDAVFASDDSRYNGDAFQIMVDFNGWSAASAMFERGIFYSFGLQEDGTVDVTVQCIAGDAASTIDYVMASDDDPEWREGEIKGMTKRKQDGSGWIAEMAISWDTLYRDISQKLADTGLEIPEVNPAYDQIILNMLICYLDHDVDDQGNDAGIMGAWGTSKKRGDLSSGEGWYPEYAGVQIDYQQEIGEAYIKSLFE